MEKKTYHPEDFKIHLKSERKVDLGKLGIAFTIDLKSNNLPTKKGDVKDYLRSQPVVIDNYMYIIKAIETPALLDHHELSSVGLLVEQWGVWHQIHPDIIRNNPYKPYNKTTFSLDGKDRTSTSDGPTEGGN